MFSPCPQTLLGKGGVNVKEKLKTNPLTGFRESTTDPQGSWTGVPADPHEVPVQDADDL